MSTAEAIEKDIEALRGQIRAFKLQLKTIRTEIIRRRFEELKSGIAGLAPAALAAAQPELPTVSLRGAEFRGVPFPVGPTPAAPAAPSGLFGAEEFRRQLEAEAAVRAAALAAAAQAPPTPPPSVIRGVTVFDSAINVTVFIPGGAVGMVALPLGASANTISIAKANNPGATVTVGGVVQ